MTAPLTIAVTGLSPVQPGIPVIRSIRDAAPDTRIVGLSYDPLDAIHYEPTLLERSYLIPRPSEGPEHVLDRLRAAQADGPIDVLLPTLDSELQVIAKLAPQLAAMGIRTFLPAVDRLMVRSKARLAAWAEESGVLVPRTKVAYTAEHAHRAAKQLGFPLIVKGHMYGARMVGDTRTLNLALDAVVGSWGYPVVLQEIIEGIEYDVIVLCGRAGEVLGAVPMKKLQLDDLNKAWGGVTVADPAIDRLVARAMKALGWRGLLELELMKSARDGRYYLIEINPRVPAWVRLAVVAGQNLPWALVRLALGEEVEPMTDYLVGAMSLRQCYDVVSPMTIYESLSMTGRVDHRVGPAGAIVLGRQPTPGRGEATARTRPRARTRRASR